MVSQSSLAFCLEWLTNEVSLAAVVIMNSMTISLGWTKQQSNSHGQPLTLSTFSAMVGINLSVLIKSRNYIVLLTSNNYSLLTPEPSQRKDDFWTSKEDSTMAGCVPLGNAMDHDLISMIAWIMVLKRPDAIHSGRG